MDQNDTKRIKRLPHGPQVMAKSGGRMANLGVPTSQSAPGIEIVNYTYRLRPGVQAENSLLTEWVSLPIPLE